MANSVSYIIFLAIIGGLILPFGGKIKFLIPILLSIILFLNFLEIGFPVKKFLRKEIFYYLIVGLGIVPLIVFFATASMELNLRMGIMLIAITPPAIGSTIMAVLIKGDQELITSNVLVYNLISPVTYAFIFNIYFNKVGVTIPLKFILNLAAIIFIPLIFALIARKFTGIKAHISKYSRHISLIAFVMVIFVGVSSASLQLRSIGFIPLATLALVIFIIAALLFSFGFLLSRETAVKRSLMIIFGHKNSTLSTWIALSNFQPVVVVPTIIYVMCHHIINGILVHKMSKN